MDDGSWLQSDWSPLRDEVLLKGTLTVIVRHPDGRPCGARHIEIRACGFK